MYMILHQPKLFKMLFKDIMELYYVMDRLDLEKLTLCLGHIGMTRIQVHKTLWDRLAQTLTSFIWIRIDSV